MSHSGGDAVAAALAAARRRRSRRGRVVAEKPEDVPRLEDLTGRRGRDDGVERRRSPCRRARSAPARRRSTRAGDAERQQPRGRPGSASSTGPIASTAHDFVAIARPSRTRREHRAPVDRGEHARRSPARAQSSSSGWPISSAAQRDGVGDAQAEDERARAGRAAALAHPPDEHDARARRPPAGTGSRRRGRPRARRRRAPPPRRRTAPAARASRRRPGTCCRKPLTSPPLSALNAADDLAVVVAPGEALQPEPAHDRRRPPARRPTTATRCSSRARTPTRIGSARGARLNARAPLLDRRAAPWAAR